MARLRRFCIFFFILAIIGLAGFLSALNYLSDGFRLSKIAAALPASDHALPVTVRDQLSQKFFYLGKGSQFYVFESEDGQCVLKFFRMNRYRPFHFPSQWPLPSFLKTIQQIRLNEKERKLRKLFQSCQLAEEKLKEESGLMYLHLEETRSLKTEAILHDRLGRPFAVEMDIYPFLLQKKAEPALPYLARLIDEGKEKDAESAMNNLFALLVRRCQIGIQDGDPEIYKNAGFLKDGKALFIDIGQFEENLSLQAASVQNKEIEKTTRKLRQWFNAAKGPASGIQCKAET